MTTITVEKLYEQYIRVLPTHEQLRLVAMITNGLLALTTPEERAAERRIAKVLDPTHLELSQPIPAKPGESIQISFSNKGNLDQLWQEAAKKHFLEAYDEGDAIYDKL